MNYTQNYHLPQWVETDRILRTDFNDMTSAIDAALDGLREDVDGNTASLARRGNCAVYLTSYTGTGTYGEDHPNVLTFPAAPVMVMVMTGGSLGVTTCNSGGLANLRPGNSFSCTVTWSEDGRTLSWYGSNNAPQMNSSGTVYQVAALVEI